jgi:hypothetical protein
MRMSGILAGALLTAVPLDAQDVPLKLGGPFFVNSPTDGVQVDPDIAADAADNYQVVWQTTAGEPVHQDVMIRRLEADLTHPGQVLLSQSTTRDQRAPRIAMEADGDWAAIWTSDHSEEDERRPYGRATSGGGTAIENEFDFTIDESPDVIGPDIALVGEEYLVGAWRENDLANSIVANFRKRKDEDVGLAPVVIGGSGSAPALAGIGDDDWVLAWHAPDASSNGAFLRCHEAEVAAEDPFPSHEATDGDQVRPDVESLGHDRFVAVWQDGSAIVGRLFLRREDGSCTPDGPAFDVGSPVAASATPRVGAGPDGAFVVTWSEEALDADGGIAAREFRHDGVAVGEPFAVHTAVPGLQNRAAVATSTTTFQVVWSHANDAMPVERDIAAQLFRRRLVFSDSFEIGGTSRWSAES